MGGGYPTGHGIFTYKSGTVIKGKFYEGRPNGWVEALYDCTCTFEGTVGPWDETGEWGGLGELRLMCEEHRKGIFFARQPVKSEQIIFPLGHVLCGLFQFVVAEDFWPIPIDITKGMDEETWE